MGQIMVIDDEPNIRMVLELALSSAGHEVLSVKNGLEGFEKLKEGFNPDLVLVDLKMPKLSGRDFVMKMRKNPQYNNTSLVILSGSMPGLGDFPPKGTYQGIVPKPFDLSKLLELTESLFSTNQSLSAN